MDLILLQPGDSSLFTGPDSGGANSWTAGGSLINTTDWGSGGDPTAAPFPDFNPDGAFVNPLCDKNSDDLFAVLSASSGRPFTVAVHPDIDISNTGRANLGFGSNDRPDLVGDLGHGGRK